MDRDELSVPQAAIWANKSQQGIRYAIARGHLPARRLFGRYWAIRLPALDAWIASPEAHRRGVAPKPKPPKRRPGRPRKGQE